MKKILFFTSPWCGGAEKMTVTISQYLYKTKYEVVFVVVGKSIEELQDLIPKDSRVILLKVKNIFDFVLLRMVRIMWKEKPHAVFGSLVYLNVRIILAATILGGIKRIVRNDNNLYYHPLSLRLMMKFIYPLADVIIAQQNEMKAQLDTFLPNCEGKILTLQNPINTNLIDTNIQERSPFTDNASYRFVWTGRIRYTKGHDILLKAFEIVKDKIPGAQCYVLGKVDETDDYYKELIHYRDSHNMKECFHFVGFKSNPHSWIFHSDCFVLPSRTEGLPNALIEAMYLLKPVVATTCIPVIERIVTEGVNGYKVKSEDYISMADAMIKAVKLTVKDFSYKGATAEDFRSLFI